MEQWDGRTLLKREKKIREAALILAGKSIAILLEKLSNCQEAQLRAINQTQGWWRKKTGKNGSKTRRILTIGNVIVNLKLPYVVERKTRQDSQKKPFMSRFLSFFKMVGSRKKGHSISLVNSS